MLFPLFETLAIIDGHAQNLAYHQHRYQSSLSKFYTNGTVKVLDLPTLITLELANFMAQTHVKNLPNVLRCRVEYNATDYHIGFFEYVKKSYPTFEPVRCDGIEYGLKFSDRQIFTDLLVQKGNADEVMIIKNGFVTDCTIGNLIFKKHGEWFTPTTPLLQGTQRAKLLNEQKISKRVIRLQDIDKFEEIRLINALNDLDFE